MSRRIADLINTAPYKPSTRQHILSLIWELAEVEKVAGLDRVSLIRDRLNSLSRSLHKTGKEQVALVNLAIYVLKRLEFRDKVPDDRCTHVVTDHAFCAATRRLGYDMVSLKDLAMKEAAAAGLRPVMEGGRIVTFLPSRGAQNVQA